MAKTERKKEEKSEEAFIDEFFHIEIKSPKEYKRFRTQEFGTKSGIERLRGQRNDGIWETVKWLVNKKMAHIENGKLIADHSEVQDLFDQLENSPTHIEFDRFEIKV